MYLEDGKCAHCGKVLHGSMRVAPHNTELNLYAVHRTYRPFFCSPDHANDAFDAVFAKDPEYQRAMSDFKEKEANEQNYFDTRERDLRQDRDAEYKKVDAEAAEDIAFWQERKDDPENQTDQTRQFYIHHINESEHLARQKKTDAEIRRDLQWQELYLKFLTAKGEIVRARDKYRNFCLEAAKGHYFDTYNDTRTKYELENAPPPPPIITDAHRFEHTHILGPTGAGKTTLIQQLVLADLAKPNPPAIVIIDPKGRMVERIAKLKRMIAGPEPLMRRVVIVDPTHTPAPPLNLFKQTGSVAAINYAINNFDYLFAQAGSELSPMMRPLFRFCARLMFSVPNADILMLMDFLEFKPGDPRFQPYIDQLTDIGAKRFFTKDFYAESYRATREQVKRRFNDILSMPEILAAFTSPSPPLDLERCLQERSIVLVHTGLTSLGPMESRILGRHIINLTIGAAFARGTNGPPAILYIDEFQDFVDEQATPKQLRLAREYNLGIICAHQNMYCEELNDALRSAISGNTAIKYCAKVYGSDRSYMLKDLGCTEEFLDAQVQDKAQQLVRFACVVKGHRPFPMSINYPNIKPEHHMPQGFFDKLLEAVKGKLHPKAMQAPAPAAATNAGKYKPHPPKATADVKPDSPPPPKKSDSDFTSEW